jgi:tripartite ATP-independent transporter DctM subunit
MSTTAIAIVAVVIFLVLICLGMNIGLALMLVGTVGYAVVVNPTAALGLLRTIPATQAGSYTLMVVPMFVMMGNFAFEAGLSEGLYKACSKWLSRLPGSLACGTVAACAGFGAICGSCAATAATMGTISIKEMRKYGYSDKLACGTVAMGGTLGVMIPPSTPMVVYAIMAECSIGSLFAAGILPGLMLAVMCILTIIILVKCDPDLAPKPTKCSWKERFSSLKGLGWVVLLFGVVLGGLFAGVFTVNQASAVGVALAMLITAIRKRMSWEVFKRAVSSTVKTAAMTFLILIGAAVFCNFLAITGLPAKLASAIAGMNVSKYVIILIMTLIYLFLGCIMDELPMIMLTVPIFLPIVTQLGFDPIWFGIYVVLVMELGAITPPVGLNCFIISGVAPDVSLGTIYKGCIPFCITIFVAIGVVTAAPDIALVLPRLFFG